MLSSVLATFDKSNYSQVRTVLVELKHDERLNIKGIIYGQLFGKMTASIFFPEVEIQPVFEKLLANNIQIYPYNDEYEQRIEETNIKLKKANTYVKDRVRSYYNNSTPTASFRTSKKDNSVKESSPELIPAGNVLLPAPPKSQKTKNEIKPNFEFLNKLEVKTDNYSLVDKYCQEGDYVSIGNIVKKNPVMNSYAKEKYVPAIKNCIKLNVDKSAGNPAYLETAINKLREIVCNQEIKLITTDDLINTASNALINICTENDPSKLIYVSNLATMGQKINVMAFIKLAELIYENEKTGEVDKVLLKKAAEQINTRFMLMAYDVMEPTLADINKNRFNNLMDTINDIKQGTSKIL